MAHAHKKKAFSLIELAIVLVIIGLLAGGVLTGQTLIRNAELQSALSEVNKYKDAVAQFQRQYQSLPGDMFDATDYWGLLAAANCQNADVTVTGDGNDTCNGNGNGVLDITSPANAQEWFHAWVHLRNAGLIEGSFTGRRVANDRQAVPGVNVPRSVLDDGGYTLMSFNANNTAGWWNGDYDLMVVFGRDTGTVETGGSLLEPEEAWNLDTKIDDGRPALGKVRSYRSSTCNTAATAVANFNIAEYLLNSSTVGCAMIFAFDDPGT